MSKYYNLFRLENLFKRHYNLISFAFSGEEARAEDSESKRGHSKKKPEWQYPEIFTFSGFESSSSKSKFDLVRNYEKNGAAHFAFNRFDELQFVRLSNSYYFDPIFEFPYRKDDLKYRSYISFNRKDLQDGKFDSLHYWFFINEKHNSAVKVDWQTLKNKLNLTEITNDYVEVDLDNISDCVTTYASNYAPLGYKHPVNFKFQKRIFTYKIVGSNKRKVKLNRADGKTCEFVSIKHFYERLSHFKVKFNVSSYGSLKSMLSQKKPIVSKCGRHRMSYEKNNDVWVFSVFSKSFEKSKPIKTVCNICADMEKAELRAEKEANSYDDKGLEWLTELGDDFFGSDTSMNDSKKPSLPTITNPNKIKCPYH